MSLFNWKDQSGLSLIELVVSTAILSIVVSLFYTGVGEYQAKSRHEDRIQSLKQHNKKIMNLISRDFSLRDAESASSLSWKSSWIYPVTYLKVTRKNPKPDETGSYDSFETRYTMDCFKNEDLIDVPLLPYDEGRKCWLTFFGKEQGGMTTCSLENKLVPHPQVDFDKNAYNEGTYPSLKVGADALPIYVGTAICAQVEESYTSTLTVFVETAYLKHGADSKSISFIREAKLFDILGAESSAYQRVR